MLDDQNGNHLPRLISIMQRLLAPDGCPWDREQTLQSLRTYLIEEAYEVIDAIESGRSDNLCEELGDLLLQVIFQAELARQKGWFGPDDVIDGICEKLIYRHPHVFGEVSLSTSKEVLANWEKLKRESKVGRGVLDGVPSSLPALLRAMRIGQKASRIGLDWAGSEEVRKKVDEELCELDQAIARGDETEARSELGDVFFALASLSRKLGIDPEFALRETLDRFTERVRFVETSVDRDGHQFSDMSREEIDSYWNRAKAKHR